MDELKHEVYANGDALGRLIQKVDQEFAANTIQHERMSYRLTRLEHAKGFA